MDRISQAYHNASGAKIVPLQTKNEGFCKISKDDNSDFSQINKENFIHSLKKESPEDFSLADLEEVESIVLDSKPKKNENATMDSELVQFYSFVIRKLAKNSRALCQ